jgi:hypothetical protein
MDFFRYPKRYWIAGTGEPFVSLTTKIDPLKKKMENPETKDYNPDKAHELAEFLDNKTYYSEKRIRMDKKISEDQKAKTASALVESPLKPKNKILSTQRYLEFASAHNSTLVLKNGGVRAVLEVTSINFNLKSTEEQEAIILSYQKFLNALDFPVQIMVRSKKLDIDNYIEKLHIRHKKITNDLLRKQMAEYMEYIQKLVEHADIMQKRFFIVIPVDPPRAQPKSLFSKFLSYIKPDDTVLDILKRRKEFSNLRKTLLTRINVVQTALENCGVPIRQLNTEEIIQVLYQTYNPDLSRTQKFERLDELSIDEGPSQNLYPDE